MTGPVKRSIQSPFFSSILSPRPGVSLWARTRTPRTLPWVSTPSMSFISSGIARAEYLVGQAGYLALLDGAIDGDFLVALVLHGDGIRDQIVVVDAGRDHLAEGVQPVFQCARGDISTVMLSLMASTARNPGKMRPRINPWGRDGLCFHGFSSPSGSGSPLRLRPNARGRVY